MNESFSEWLVITVLVLVGICIAAATIVESSECKERGGTMVRGVSDLDYECVKALP